MPTATTTAADTILLTQHECESLIAAARNIAAIAPKFAGWLLGSLPDLSESGGKTVKLPVMPTKAWTDGDVADALVASFEFYASLGPDLPNAQRFAGHVHMVNVYLIHARLRGI